MVVASSAARSAAVAAEARAVPHRAAGPVRDRPADRRRRLLLRPDRRRRGRSAAVVLFVFQYLVRAGVAGFERGEELRKRTRELAALQVGPAQHGHADALDARRDDRAAFGRRRPLRPRGRRDARPRRARAGSHPHRRAAARHRQVHLPGLDPRSPTASSRTRSGRWSSCTRSRAPSSSRRIEGYGPVADIIISHHERFDGNGYPRPRRDDIPLGLAHHRRGRHVRRDDLARLVPPARSAPRPPSPSCAASRARSSTPWSSRPSSR